jgi:hypothetical protein
MLTYETHKSEIGRIFDLINSGRFYSLTFIKKGDGQVRYLNGKRMLYKAPDGSDAVVKNVGYDPKNYNLIRVYDRNALNPKTNQRTGGYRSAALENIVYIKCGSELFDFVQENDIQKRFPHVNLQEIQARMKIGDIVDDEAQDVMGETYEVLGIQQLAQVIADMNSMEDVPADVYYEAAIDTLTKAFRYGGDEAVQQEFKNNTGKDLNVISKGKYTII